jgi:hypothetical protein
MIRYRVGEVALGLRLWQRLRRRLRCRRLTAPLRGLPRPAAPARPARVRRRGRRLPRPPWPPGAWPAATACWPPRRAARPPCRGAPSAASSAASAASAAAKPPAISASSSVSFWTIRSLAHRLVPGSRWPAPSSRRGDVPQHDSPASRHCRSTATTAAPGPALAAAELSASVRHSGCASAVTAMKVSRWRHAARSCGRSRSPVCRRYSSSAVIITGWNAGAPAPPW